MAVLKGWRLLRKLGPPRHRNRALRPVKNGLRLQPAASPSEPRLTADEYTALSSTWP